MKAICFALVLALVACGAMNKHVTSGLATIKAPSVYDGMRCSLIARQIAWSLDHEPLRWSTDGYRVERDEDGASVWVANGVEGVNIGPTHGSSGATTWDDACGQQMVWRAYQRWLVKSTGQTP